MFARHTKDLEIVVKNTKVPDSIHVYYKSALCIYDKYNMLKYKNMMLKED